MTLSDQLADLADSLDRMTASGKVSSIQKSILSLEEVCERRRQGLERITARLSLNHILRRVEDTARFGGS